MIYLKKEFKGFSVGQKTLLTKKKKLQFTILRMTCSHTALGVICNFKGKILKCQLLIKIIGKKLLVNGNI